MNTKIKKIARDIEKIEARITADQARVAELKRQQTEMENTEIVNLFRAVDVAPGELVAMITAYRENGARPALSKGEAVDE